MIRRLQAVKKDTGQSFAVKIIERANAAFDIEALKKEIDTMQRINHPNCIRLHDVFEEVRLLSLPAPPGRALRCTACANRVNVAWHRACSCGHTCACACWGADQRRVQWKIKCRAICWRVSGPGLSFQPSTFSSSLF